MSLFSTRGLLTAQNILFQCKRFRGKINIKRPRAVFYEKALFNAVTQPIYHRTPITEECRQKQEMRLLRTKQERQIHPYQLILANELFDRLNTANMIVFCHVNSYTNQEVFKTQVELFKKGIHYKIYGKGIFNDATRGTKFEVLSSLFNNKTAILYSKEVQVEHTLKTLRKFPRLIALAGVVEGRILSKNELVNYSKMPNLEIVRAQFAATLSSPGNSIVNNLQSHQSNLCYLLDAHAKALGETTDVAKKNDEVASAEPLKEENKTEETPTNSGN